VVHNGIITNDKEVKVFLESKGKILKILVRKNQEFSSKENILKKKNHQNCESFKLLFTILSAVKQIDNHKLLFLVFLQGIKNIKMKIAFWFHMYRYMIIFLGFKFVSQTDTEVIAKMIKYMYDLYPESSFSELVEMTVKELEGKVFPKINRSR
jgi:hypothetical protein